jgi:hypothetical protein
MTYSFKPRSGAHPVGLLGMRKRSAEEPRTFKTLVRIAFLAIAVLISGNAFGQKTFYLDFDRDGYGNPLNSIVSAVPVKGYVTNRSDCNDLDNSIYPNAPELCDGIDHNCDGFIPSPPVLTLIASDSVVCGGKTVVISAVDENDQPVAVEWSTGSYGTSLIIAPTKTRTYWATYTAETGCMVNDSVTILFSRPSFAALLPEAPQQICPGEQAVIYIEVSGPAGPWTVSYTDGTTVHQFLQTSTVDTIVVTPDVTTTYQLLSVSSQFCGGVASGSYTVNVEEKLSIAPIADITVNADNSCSAVSDVPVTITGTPDPSVKFLVNGDTTTMPYIFPVGQSNVTVIASNRCGAVSESLVVTVKDTQAPVFTTSNSDITIANASGICGEVVSWTSPQATDNCGYTEIKQTSGPASGSIFPVGSTTISYVAIDASGNDTTQTFIVTVSNAAPVLTNLQTTPSSASVGSTVSVSAQVADNNLTSASINWGDGSTTSASVAANISGTHAYTQAGTFTVSVTVTDACNASHTLTSTVIITESTSSSECFVTANGWFNSPKNAYTNCKNATGKAHFNINAKSKDNGSLEGKATLNFQAGDLKFESKTLESLQCSDNRAVLKGTGKLNGSSGFRFTVTMENEPNGNGHSKHSCAEDDKLRFRIWNSSNVLVYDNQRGAAESATPPEIEGGSIIFHKNEKGNGRIASEAIAENFEGANNVTAYPNPFIDRLVVEFYSDVEEGVSIHLMDVAGNTIYDQKHGYSYEGLYEVELGNQTLSNQVYLIKVNQGNRSEVLKVVRK